LQNSTIYAQTGTWVYAGASTTDNVGYKQFALSTTTYPTGSYVVKLVQDVILANGTGLAGVQISTSW